MGVDKRVLEMFAYSDEMDDRMLFNKPKHVCVATAHPRHKEAYMNKHGMQPDLSGETLPLTPKELVTGGIIEPSVDTSLVCHDIIDLPISLDGLPTKSFVPDIDTVGYSGKTHWMLMQQIIAMRIMTHTVRRNGKTFELNFLEYEEMLRNRHPLNMYPDLYHFRLLPEPFSRNDRNMYMDGKAALEQLWDDCQRVSGQRNIIIRLRGGFQNE